MEGKVEIPMEPCNSGGGGEVNTSPPADSTEIAPPSLLKRKLESEEIPRQPTAPLFPFQRFQREVYSSVKAKMANRAVQPGQLSRLVGLMWRSLTTDAKKKYVDAYEKERIVYAKSWKDYEERLSTVMKRKLETAQQQPITPFMRFQQEIWQSVMEKNRHCKVWEIGKIIAELWRKLPLHQRKKFFDAYEKEKIENRGTNTKNAEEESLFFEKLKCFGKCTVTFGDKEDDCDLAGKNVARMLRQLPEHLRRNVEFEFLAIVRGHLDRISESVTNGEKESSTILLQQQSTSQIDEAEQQQQSNCAVPAAAEERVGIKEEHFEGELISQTDDNVAVSSKVNSLLVNMKHEDVS